MSANHPILQWADREIDRITRTVDRIMERSYSCLLCDGLGKVARHSSTDDSDWCEACKGTGHVSFDVWAAQDDEIEHEFMAYYLKQRGWYQLPDGFWHKDEGTGKWTEAELECAYRLQLKLEAESYD